MPEKRLGRLHYAQMAQTFRTDAFGPALVLAHFTPLLDRQRGVRALLSAKVGNQAADAAADLLRVIDALRPEHTGSFRAYNGDALPW